MNKTSNNRFMSEQISDKLTVKVEWVLFRSKGPIFFICPRRVWQINRYKKVRLYRTCVMYEGTLTSDRGPRKMHSVSQKISQIPHNITNSPSSQLDYPEF